MNTGNGVQKILRHKHRVLFSKKQYRIITILKIVAFLDSPETISLKIEYIIILYQNLLYVSL